MLKPPSPRLVCLTMEVYFMLWLAVFFCGIRRIPFGKQSLGTINCSGDPGYCYDRQQHGYSYTHYITPIPRII
jgi:hypothetical protein